MLALVGEAYDGRLGRRDGVSGSAALLETLFSAETRRLFGDRPSIVLNEVV